MGTSTTDSVTIEKPEASDNACYLVPQDPMDLLQCDSCQ